jgi:hypothetical protein
LSSTIFASLCLIRFVYYIATGHRSPKSEIGGGR